jgi:ribose transport system substrate-binding protein
MGDFAKRGPLAGLELEMVGDRLKKGFKRRDTFKGGFAMLGALAMATGVGREATAAQGLASLGLLPEDLPEKTLRAAFSEQALQNSWPARGAETAKMFADLLGVDLVVYDGQNVPEKQRQDMDDIATQDWDFVAIHPAAINANVDPVNALTEKGVAVIDMDTYLADDLSTLDILTFLEPDNIYMGETMAKVLFDSIGGEGEVIHTQGRLTHTGAQKRGEGFNNMLANYPGITVVDETPGDWDRSKVASLWQDLLVRYPDVKGGYFHNDDMALAAAAIV